MPKKGGASGRPPSPPRRRGLRAPEEIWGRRSAWLGAALLAVAISGAIALLASGDGASGQSPKADSRRAELARVEQLARQTLTRSAHDKRRGIRVSYPKSWRRRHDPGAVLLRSPSDCVAVSFSAPGRQSESKRLRDQAIDEAREAFPKTKVTRGGGRIVGGISMSGAALRLGERGSRARMLLLAGAGRRYTYLVQTLIRGSCPSHLLQAREIIATVRLSR